MFVCDGKKGLSKAQPHGPEITVMTVTKDKILSETDRAMESKGEQNRPKTKENNYFVKSIFRSADMGTGIP